MTLGTIELRGLRAMGICGALPEERDRPQPLEVDLDVVADVSEAGRTDDLAHAVDYAVVCDLVERIVVDERFTLLEALATRVADAVLSDQRVHEVTVAVRKLRPPVAQALDTAGVRLTVIR